MKNLLHSQKGVALVMALGMLLVAIILANVLLTMMLSHSRLTQHQVGRIQAYYAATAGMNLAMENLRTGVWEYNAATSTNSCPNSSPPNPPACTVSDPDFFRPNNPNSVITSITIVFCPRNAAAANCLGATTTCNPPPGNDFCVTSTVAYRTESTTD